jgi:hypothetical protein
MGLKTRNWSRLGGDKKSKELDRFKHGGRAISCYLVNQPFQTILCQELRTIIEKDHSLKS